MTNRVSKLVLVEGSSTLNLSPDSVLQRIQNYMDEHGMLDVSGELEDDIELEPSSGDERKLGPLDALERRMFSLATLLEQSLNDYIVEVQAVDAERITHTMREHRLTFLAAAAMLAQESGRSPEVTVQQRAFINMCGITHTHLITSYDWSVRSRYNEWTRHIIVRKGFIVYSHG